MTPGTSTSWLATCVQACITSSRTPKAATSSLQTRKHRLPSLQRSWGLHTTPTPWWALHPLLAWSTHHYTAVLGMFKSHWMLLHTLQLKDACFHVHFAQPNSLLKCAVSCKDTLSMSAWTDVHTAHILRGHAAFNQCIHVKRRAGFHIAA